MNERGRAASGFIVRCLTGLFAPCAFCLILLGAGVYRNIAASGRARSAGRVLTEYARTKLRNTGGAAYIEEGVLVIPETAGEETYLTRLYLYEGRLTELMTEADAPFRPEDGEPLVEAAAFEPEIKDGLLALYVEDEYAGARTVYAALGEGGAR